MAYFLKNFLDARKTECSSSIDDPEDLFEASTSKFGYDDPEKKTRDGYSKLLAICSKALHRPGVLYGEQNEKENDAGGLEDLDGDLIQDICRYMHVSAQPSSFGANMLARTVFMR